MPMRNNEFWVKGLIAAALLSAPMVGCSSGGDDDSEGTPTPTQAAATATAEPTATNAPEPTDPPTINGFPVGQYEDDFWYLYPLGDGQNPPVAILIALTWDETSTPVSSSARALGDYTGTFLAFMFDSYQGLLKGDDYTCLVRENITGIAKSEEDLGSFDLDQCQFCRSYAAISIAYRNHEGEGCTEDKFDGYYGYTDPLESQAYETYWGYRHAADDSWPEDFADDGPDLEADGYVGSLFEADGDGGFYAAYVVVPTDLNSKIKVGGLITEDDVKARLKTLPVSKMPFAPRSLRHR